MRPSQLKHPVAVLRKIIGLRQKELADLVGVNEATIQSVELGPGRLKLSERLAQRISHETAVDLGWLLNGDPTARPTCKYDGRDYSAEVFLKRQAQLRNPGLHRDDDQLTMTIFAAPMVISALVGLFALVAKKGKEANLLLYKTEQFVFEMAREFTPDLVSGHRDPVYALNVASALQKESPYFIYDVESEVRTALKKHLGCSELILRPAPETLSSISTEDYRSYRKLLKGRLSDLSQKAKAVSEEAKHTKRLITRIEKRKEKWAAGRERKIGWGVLNPRLSKTRDLTKTKSTRRRRPARSSLRATLR